MRYLLAALVLLSGCVQRQEIRQFNDGYSRHVRAVMFACADAVRKVSIPLTPAERDYLYSDCLVQNNATI